MSDAALRWQDERFWTAVLLVALVPLLAMSCFTAPQTDDFCYGAIALHDGFAGIWRHYQNWSGRLVATTLIPLPTILSVRLHLDLFAVYAGFAASFLLSFAVACHWLIGTLLPDLAPSSRRFFAVALFIVLVANAPTTRHLVFWMPGAFTYSLPAFVMLSLFMLLYRALADRTWLGRRQVLLFIPALFLAALCNETTGPTAAVMLVLSLYGRRYLALERAQTAQHILLIAAALAGTLIVYLAPGNLLREATRPGSASLIRALCWGTLSVPAFLVLHLARPGVIGWFLLLALLAAPYSPLPPDRRRARVLLGFALLTPLGACWLSFVAGYYGQGNWLPERAQNPLFLLGILGLSCALLLARRFYGQRLIEFPDHLRKRLTIPRLRVAGVVLLLLSPAVVGAFWQLPQAPAFRREARAQLHTISADPGPISHVRQIATTPGLLFNNKLSPDAGEWPNLCIARYFSKRAVIPMPQ
jgi:hypothetical protein